MAPASRKDIQLLCHNTLLHPCFLSPSFLCSLPSFLSCFRSSLLRRTSSTQLQTPRTRCFSQHSAQNCNYVATPVIVCLLAFPTGVSSDTTSNLLITSSPSQNTTNSPKGRAWNKLNSELLLNDRTSGGHSSVMLSFSRLQVHDTHLCSPRTPTPPSLTHTASTTLLILASLSKTQSSGEYRLGMQICGPGQAIPPLNQPGFQEHDGDHDKSQGNLTYTRARTCISLPNPSRPQL